MPQAAPITISQPILELDGISRVYHTKGNIFGHGARKVVALNEVSLTVGRGEVFGLVGESGSGKTTAGRLIVRLERPDQGAIRLEGDDIVGLKGQSLQAYRRRVQMVFQDPYQSLNPQVSILDSVAEPLVTHKISDPREHLDKVVQVLDRVGLSPAEDFIYRFPHQLSGGQRQRVAIARAVILEPDLLVADEPTSMLDASYSAQIFEILLGVRDQMDATIIFITHSLAAARYLCDRIAVIYHGNLMELGPASQVISAPKHPYTQALIDATPKFGRCAEVPTYGTLLADERQVDETSGCPFFHRCQRADLDLCANTYPDWHPVGLEQVALCHFAKDQPGPELAADQCRIGGN